MKMKPKYLYHGSIRKIKGEKFIPKKPQDLENNPENLHKGVYATNIKGIAIAMAIISCKGVYGAGLKFIKKPYGKIYDGWPNQKYIYLYTLPSKSFKSSGEEGKQWVSAKDVKPVKVEKLAVEDYLGFVKKATSNEIKRWLKKHNLELMGGIKK